VFDFPSLIFLKRPFHCEHRYGFGFEPISLVLRKRVCLLILVGLLSFSYFQFQIIVLYLNSFVCIDFILGLCFLVGSSHFCFGIGVNSGHNKDFCMNHHLNIIPLNYLFYKIFALILMILPRLLSFTDFPGLFIIANVLGKYACLDRLFILLMNLLARITLIYRVDDQSSLDYRVCVLSFFSELESRYHGMVLDP